MVEHHREIMEIADHIVDMGPGAGIEGGTVLFEGSYPELLRCDTLTGRLLRQKTQLKRELRQPRDWYHMKDVHLHNLQHLDVSLPLGVLTVVAGVAGSGKSSLMEVFEREYPGQIVSIQQKDIGVSLRSTPATYTGVADDIRKLFAQRSGKPVGLYSFNGQGGCPVCGGKGVIVSDMAFMDAVETVCEACGGLRYSPEALEFQLEGRNISQVMDLTVRQASQLFAGTSIERKLKPLMEVGLKYLHLNQALSTLSGGELQRMKLASHLQDGGQIFILDEPTNGLHLQDIQNMIALFDRLVDQGNSLFVIEHNLDVLKAADYVLELGPSGGGSGGQLLFAGTPRDMAACPDSVTRQYLN